MIYFFAPLLLAVMVQYCFLWHLRDVLINRAKEPSSMLRRLVWREQFEAAKIWRPYYRAQRREAMYAARLVHRFLSLRARRSQW